MSFTVLELRALHRDLSKWLRSIERHLAAESGEDGPHLESGDPGDQLAELSLLVRRHEVVMLLKLADEIEGIEGGEVERMKQAARYSFHWLFQERFGAPPVEVQTSGAELTESAKELPG